MTYDWCAEARAKLAAMDDLVAQGRGLAVIEGGGCSEPGGGIVATQRTALDTAALLRQQVAQSCGAAPPSGSTAGAYDRWWRTYGARSGHPYSPPVSADAAVRRHGQPVAGFSVGTGGPPRPSECACRKVLGDADGSLGSPPAAVGVSPWALALTTSVIGAATGWVIEEIASAVRGRRRRR